MNNNRILIAAGGTGGHIFPAIAIANEIKKMNPFAEILFVGTKGKIEERVVPQQGYKLNTIWISGFHRSFQMNNLLFPIKVVVSLIQSFFVIKIFKPDIAVGTGGYVCGPVLYMASLLGIPTVVHESNSYPGVTTRILSSKATKIFTAFEATTKWLKNKTNVELAGTPTRSVLTTVTKEDGKRFFNLSTSKKTVLVFGGSLGAYSINQAIKEIIGELSKKEIQMIWQVGKNNTNLVNEMSGLRNLWIGEFIDKMEYAFAAADIVICRAGAMTIAELTLLGKPAILIPYPFAAADHQTFNAKTLADTGGAIMIADNEIKLRLKNELIALLNDENKLKQMSLANKKLGNSEAGKVIAKKILELKN